MMIMIHIKAIYINLGGRREGNGKNWGKGRRYLGEGTVLP
jgi:hypothetical protein